MLITDKKLIFVHVIKTAGVSVETLFEQDYTHDHRTALEYQKILGIEEYKRYFSFTIIRNPWDKMVSQYYYNAFNWVPENTSFKEYIKRFANGEQITRFSPFHLPYITNDVGEIMVDYIGRFEALDETMAVVAKAIDSPYLVLPHKNKSGRSKDYTEYYDDESREIIAELFKAEIKLFDYKFGM